MTARSYLYAGCYTHESSAGIHVYDSTAPSGELVKLGEDDNVEHPSFLAVHPSGDMLYAVSEVASDGGGSVCAFRVDVGDGSLTMIDRVSSQGAAPCYVSVDAAGRYLYVANYVSGTIAVHALTHDGRFGELVGTHQHRGSGPSTRQEGPHAHCILPGTDGASVYGVDLGTDRIMHYVHGRQTEGETFSLDDELLLHAGAGPRHIVFHPQQPVAFLVCELDSTLVELGVDPNNGRLTRLRSSQTLPDGFVGESIAAEVRVHPSGRHVYVSNRGHDSIAVFSFTGVTDPLELLGHVPSGGATPRNFAIHPSGRALLVANQHSDAIVPFEIDPTSGIPHQSDLAYGVSAPVCLTFLEVAR